MTVFTEFSGSSYGANAPVYYTIKQGNPMGVCFVTLPKQTCIGYCCQSMIGCPGTRTSSHSLPIKNPGHFHETGANQT